MLEQVLVNNHRLIKDKLVKQGIETQQQRGSRFTVSIDTLLPPVTLKYYLCPKGQCLQCQSTRYYYQRPNFLTFTVNNNQNTL